MFSARRRQEEQSARTAPMLDLRDRLDRAGSRRTTSGAWEQATGFFDCLAVIAQEHRLDPGLPDLGARALARIADVFGLDPVATAVLWAVAAPDLDATAGLAYGRLRESSTATRATVALALELAGVATGSPQAFELLGSSSRLRRQRLVQVADASLPWLAQELSCPEPVLAALVDGIPTDPVVDRLRVELAPADVPGAELVAAALEANVPLTWVRSANAHAGTALAAGAFERLRLHWLAIDLRRHDSAHRLSDVAALAARDAGLRGWGLVVTGCETVAESTERDVFDVLGQAAVPVVAVSSKAWNALWGGEMPLVVEAEPLAPDDRTRIWSDALDQDVTADPDLAESLRGLRLPGESILEAARYARTLAAARRTPVGVAEVREGARRIGGAGGTDRFSGLATSAGPTFADLMLPGHVTDSLRSVVSWARHRDSLGATGILRGRGRGISALFTGNPGTGKTLAAHVIAEELAIDLFQVDLSSIVDKYIGETEKNLERVFQAAEALDVVLFFDEADALFGKRSDVSDARDRYANQEVAYLLQRMENFDGITVLSTNLRGNLDKAFSRRMSFIINFPDPDVATRVRLWEHHLSQLPMLDRDDPIDVEHLARTAELAGGDIRNIVLSAAYEAAGEGTPVGNRHLAGAAVREYHKLGRMVPEHAFTRR